MGMALALVVASEPLILPIAPGINDTLGVYLPILSVNTVLSTLCARAASKRVRPFLLTALLRLWLTMIASGRASPPIRTGFFQKSPSDQRLCLMVDAVVYSAGFALAMALIACVRELFGSNTIWGIDQRLCFL